MTVRSITVSQLNEYIKNLFASDRMLSAVCVTGELSNFKRHSSGHLYFTLKDSDAAVQAVMFRSDAARLRFSPESGMKVIVTGRVSLYPKSGQYQIYVNTMQPDGIGSLYLAGEARDTVAPDLTDYIMEGEAVRVALRTARDADLSEEEWLAFARGILNRGEKRP